MNTHFKYMLFFVGICLCSCKKYLDKKPDISLNIPTTLDDFQRLADNDNMVDNSTPGVNDLGSDNYILSDMAYLSVSQTAQNCYIWKPDIWAGQNSADWAIPYGIIYRSNVIIEGLNDFKVNVPDDKVIWNSIYGKALFLRGAEHYYLHETFGQPYNPATAGSDIGIPLKLTANLASISKRSTVQETFDQIINDLSEAAILVPVTTVARNRPSKAAVYGMLARVYLTMQDYTKAKQFADSSLFYNNSLFNYNDLSASAISGTLPFSAFASPNDMPEILFPSYQASYNILTQTILIADTALVNSYDVNDLRKPVFFRLNTPANTYSFKASYSANSGRFFSGPAVDEMYLIRAECKARAGDKDGAMTDLNALLIKRYKTGTFTPITAANGEDALRKVLVERRKEMILRGQRWSDLRRLNQDTRFAVTLKRKLSGQDFDLPPNDAKYTYPIPDNEIRLSGLEQNIR